MEYLIIFYHPKNPLNARDVCRVGSKLNAKTLVIPRPGGGDLCSRIGTSADCTCKSMSVSGLAGLLGGEEIACVIILETYGDESIVDVVPRCARGGIVAVIIGAEDYGVPQSVAEQLMEGIGTSKLAVAKIPYTALGYSYNVVSALVMALYELERAKRSDPIGGY